MTLVAGYGCPLGCRYCLNPACSDPQFSPRVYTVSSLFERVRVDSLYFEATGGGITFGGGEPLLQAEFLRDFIRYVRDSGLVWRFGIETSLAVAPERVAMLLDDAPPDSWLVDVKDMNPAIYRAYTGQEPEKMRQNLATLAARCPNRVTVRVPRIPDYNTDEDCDSSERILRDMGFGRIDRFTYRT